ncbi:MAG: dihydroorotate dehydrogenase electron transfer subunit [Candidatus Omnitrophota bacterium]
MVKKKIIQAKIISNRKIAADHYVIRVEAAHLGRNSSPGQFVTVKAEEGTTDPLLRIPLGVHAVRKEGIDLLYKVVGPATELLRSKEKGEKIGILGPLGKGFDLASLLREKDSEAVIVAGGHGVAPLCALAETIIKKKKKVDFFIGACAKKHVVCTEKLKKLGARVYVATEDGTRGYKGYVTGLLQKHLKRKGLRLRSGQAKNKTRQWVYACGPKPMLAELAKVVKKYNVQAQVSLDAYMACGIGSCLGCAVRTKDGYKLVCKDGPVFDAQEIKWI